MSTSQFRIANHDFAIKDARLEPFRSEDDAGGAVVCWGVFIVAQESDLLPRANACINFEHLLETKAGQLASWRDLAGTILAWEDPSDGPEGQFLVWEGEEIRNCHWEFLRGENGSLVLKLRGTTDINYDEPFNSDVSFDIETELSIAPWPMGHSSEAECLETYRQLGLKDAVEYRLDGTVSCLVFKA